MYVKNLYSDINDNVKDILEAIEYTIEDEDCRTIPCYHIVTNGNNDKDNDVTVDIHKIYYKSDAILNTQQDLICSTKITNDTRNNNYIIQFIGDVPYFSIITKLFPLLKDDKPIHIVTEKPVIIDTEDISINYPNVVILNSIENQVLNCEKEIEELLNKYPKEMLKFFLEGE